MRRVLITAFVVGLVLIGARGALATPPPTLEVSVIGHGLVTDGSGAISCGSGNLHCATAFGSADASLPLTETPKDGWSFVHWEQSGGGACDASTSTTCDPGPLNGDNAIVAVFKTSGTVTPVTLNVTPSDTAGGEVLSKLANYPIDCGTTGASPPTTNTMCSLQVVGGSTITVSERANDGFFFKAWGGDSCSGSGFTCSVYMTGNHNVSAAFVASGTNTLTVNVNGAGSVTGDGVNCSDGATCNYVEPPGANLALQATPADGYAFTGWDDDCQGAQTTCNVDMSAARTVTANFAKLVPLLLTVNGAGTVSGAGLTCGPGQTTCSGSVAPGSTIQFTAAPTAVGGTTTWLGCTSAAGPVCNVVVGTSPISITTTFSGGTTTGGGGSFVQLSINVDGNGYVTASGATIYCTAAGGTGCIATVPQNTTVSVHAVPASGSSADFVGWTGCVSSTTTCTITMSTAKSITATFDPADDTTYDLTAAVTGSGSVTGAGLNSCRVTGSTACTSPQAASAHVTLAAVPSPGATFTGWGGDCTGTSPTCTLTMNSDQNVTATFKSTAPATDKLSLTVTGAGTVTGGTSPCVGKSAKPATCTSSERSSATIELHALPAKGWVFAGWTGTCAGTKPACTIVMNADATVGATFKPASLAATAKKPTVVKTAAGYRITIAFRAGEAGRLTVTTKPKTTTLRTTVKTGTGTVRVTVKKRGRYVVTLSLRSKSGTHALHFTVKV